MVSTDPANTGHSPNAVSMLAHRLRRWPNIETALGECPVFAGDKQTVKPINLYLKLGDDDEGIVKW